MRRVFGNRNWALATATLVAIAAGCSSGGHGGGGSASTGNNNIAPTQSQGLGTPSTNTLAQGVAYHTATSLPSGNVLVRVVYSGNVDFNGAIWTDATPEILRAVRDPRLRSRQDPGLDVGGRRYDSRQTVALATRPRAPNPSRRER